MTRSREHTANQKHYLYDIIFFHGDRYGEHLELKANVPTTKRGGH